MLQNELNNDVEHFSTHQSNLSCSSLRKVSSVKVICLLVVEFWKHLRVCHTFWTDIPLSPIEILHNALFARQIDFKFTWEGMHIFKNIWRQSLEENLGSKQFANSQCEENVGLKLRWNGPPKERSLFLQHCFRQWCAFYQPCSNLYWSKVAWILTLIG